MPCLPACSHLGRWNGLPSSVFVYLDNIFKFRDQGGAQQTLVPPAEGWSYNQFTQVGVFCLQARVPRPRCRRQQNQTLPKTHGSSAQKKSQAFEFLLIIFARRFTTAPAADKPDKAKGFVCFGKRTGRLFRPSKRSHPQLRHASASIPVRQGLFEYGR